LKKYVNLVGMKRKINMCLFMSTSVACAVGCPKCYCIFNWFFLPKPDFLDFIWAWALRCFTLLMMMNYFLRKDIYFILVHILGRERCICCLWGFVNVFTFVWKHIEIFWDQIQARCPLHMLLWKHHMMSCLFVTLHLHMCITSCSHL